MKECFNKKQKEVLSSSVTLHIPSFGITVGPNSYIGSDRMLRTVADLWELPRIKTDKAKVVHKTACAHAQTDRHKYTHNAHTQANKQANTHSNKQKTKTHNILHYSMHMCVCVYVFPFTITLYYSC